MKQLQAVCMSQINIINVQIRWMYYKINNGNTVVFFSVHVIQQQQK